MIYLNKTGFNGLYRVNRRGGFNVPFGRYKNPKICDADNLRAASERLQGVDILHSDFEDVEERCKPGDFVYFDPPLRARLQHGILHGLHEEWLQPGRPGGVA